MTVDLLNYSCWNRTRKSILCGCNDHCCDIRSTTWSAIRSTTRSTIRSISRSPSNHHQWRKWICCSFTARSSVRSICSCCIRCSTIPWNCSIRSIVSSCFGPSDLLSSFEPLMSIVSIKFLYYHVLPIDCFQLAFNYFNLTHLQCPKDDNGTR